jgi:alpha-glucosidase
MLLLTLKGTPVLFAGDELGMEQIDIPPDRIQDPFEKLVPGYSLNRDPERSPMRWDNSRNAGFTTGEPWLPMGSEIAERNVERLKCGSRSLLILYRSLITLRKQWPALTEGEYEPIRSRNDILVFKRIGPDSLLIALNLTHEPRRLEWSGSGTLLLSTYLDDAQVVIECPRLLRADEGIIVKLR